jgi:hypothetical protein
LNGGLAFLLGERRREMKKLLGFLLTATVIFLCLTPGISKAVIIDFEDLPYTPTNAILPSNYMGFSWWTFDYFHKDFYNGVHSGLFAINNNAATTYIDFGAFVDFNGAYFTNYPPHVYSVTITGYNSGQIMYERVLAPDDLSAEPRYIDLSFNGIDKIMFYSPDAQFFMDDLDITPLFNQAPIADCGDDMVVVFDEVTLDGSASYDPDGTIVAYEWSLQHEDGSIITASGPNPTISDIPPGAYEVILTITDDEGLTDTDIMHLAAAGPCPISPVPDEDEDGEPDITDLCPDTQPDTEVDSSGCSLAQFCAAIDTNIDHGRKICDHSDWKNDEPLENKGDCEAIKEGQGPSNYLCVPR